MAKQPEHSTERYNAVFPTVLRSILESHPVDGHSTTYKALGEAVGVRQQTISQYASGQTQPTADVLLRMAQQLDVSVDYLLTGVSSQNKSYSEDLGLSDSAVECLKRARVLAQRDDPSRTGTIPYLDELLADKDFYQFLEDIHFYVGNLQRIQGMTEEEKERFQGINAEGYFIWELQMFVQEFIRNEVNKLGLKIDVI